MADGVAQVQQGPLAAVKLVVFHHVPLHAHTGGNDGLKLLPDGGFRQLLEQFRTEQHGSLDDLGAARPVFGLRQGGQQGRVAQHQRGLVEAARLVFAAVQVHGGLAAYGGIHHGQQGGGHLDIGHAPLVGGGGEARQIPHNAAAQSDDEVAPGETAVAEEVQCLTVGIQIFLLFSMGEYEVLHLKSGVLQGSFCQSAVQGKHGVVGNDGGPAAGEKLRRHEAQPGEKALLNGHVIAPGGGYMDGSQWPSTSSFRLRPSSSSWTRPGRSLRSMAS